MALADEAAAGVHHILPPVRVVTFKVTKGQILSVLNLVYNSGLIFRGRYSKILTGLRSDSNKV